MLRFFVAALLLATLPRCTVLHTPKKLAPYFPKDLQAEFSQEDNREQGRIQAKRQQTLFEANRLRELYQKELVTLDPNHPRARWLQSEIERLAPQTQQLAIRKGELLNETPLTKRPAVTQSREVEWDPFEQAYQNSRKLWNRNKNAEALIEIDSVVQSKRFQDERNHFQVIRWGGLRFGVLIDLGLWKQAADELEALKKVDSCHSSVVSMGFRLALLTHWLGDAQEATRLFAQLCLPSERSEWETKYLYWEGRLTGDPQLAQEIFERLAQRPFPDYYVFLAQARTGSSYLIGRLPQRSVYEQPIEVSSDISKKLLLVEQLIQANLRRRATRLLNAVSDELTEDWEEADLAPLLYCAHLFAASGKHLNAIKIYVRLQRFIQKHSPQELANRYGWVDQMYPRPYSQQVEWQAEMWGVDSDLIYSLMRQESAFDPNAISYAGAQGLLQMMPFLSEWMVEPWGYGNYYTTRYTLHPEENIKFAALYLFRLKKIFNHPILMAAAYNAGYRRVIRWWQRYDGMPLDLFVEVIPANQPREYGKYVFRNLIYYKGIRNNFRVPSDVVPLDLAEFPYERKELQLKALE